MVRFFSYLVYIPIIFLVDIFWQLVSYDLSSLELRIGYVFSVGFILFGLVFIIDFIVGVIRNNTLHYWKNETRKDIAIVSLLLVLILLLFLILLPNIERSVFLSYLVITILGGIFRFLLLVRN